MRRAIVAAGRRLGARGLISAGEGNLSVRLGDGWMLITPTSLRKDELQADDLIVVSIRPGDEAPRAATSAPGLQPSSDVAIHRAVYEARADVRAIAHAHLPASMALTLAGEVPDTTSLPETALLLPRLPFVALATMGSAELAGAVAAALATGPEPLPGAVLLERHGAVGVGQSVDEAVNRLELVEVLCRTWTNALLIRAAVAGTGGRAILPASGLRPGTPVRGGSRRDQ